MSRYAAFAVLHGMVVVVALTGLLGAASGLAVLVASVPLLLAWGAFQADVAVNPRFDETARYRWRIVLWVLPWSMAVYWQLHVRPREVH